METIYPNDFFAIEHPTAPLVNIQFRTHITGNDITDPSNWESVTFNPSTFFNDLTIEDQGGAQMLNLNLFDKNYARMENVIVKSILAARLANKLVGEPNYSVDDTTYFEFYVSKASSANVRIRFGYSMFGDDDGYIDETSTVDETWKTRTEQKKTVARSPWLYFQISGANFKLSQEGLKIEIKAFSVTGSFLDKAKMVQKFARFVGPPKAIIEQIGELVTNAASLNGETVAFEFIGDPPEGYSTPDGENSIEIMLGSEASVPRFIEEEGVYRSERLYKSLRMILQEICSKVRPIIYDENGDKITQQNDSSSEGTGINEDNEAIDKIANYSYTIAEGDTETKIQFYYQDPNDQINKQTYIRTYIWNEDGHSIVKNFDVETKTDFAMLNLQIATIDTDTGELTLHVATGHASEEDPEQQDDSVDYTIGNLRDASAALESSDFNSMFVTNIRETNNFQVSNEKLGSGQAGALLSRKIISNLNNQVFTGTISLPGDPYYLFDSSIKPFSYLIKIIVRRPNYVDDQGEFVEGGTSYASGLYVIKKITQKISGSGYDTDLSVMKWPRKTDT